MLLSGRKPGAIVILKPASIAAMQANEWTWNEAANNVHNYLGLFRSWGLGTQWFTDSDRGDPVLAAGGFKGHERRPYLFHRRRRLLVASWSQDAAV